MDTVVLEVERRLLVGAAEARTLLVRALRSQDFTVTGEQVATITAKRGSQLAGSVQPKKLPISATIGLQPDAAGCVVRIRLADAWRSGVGKVWGMNGPYRSVLAEVQRELDAAVRPVAADGAEPADAEVHSAVADVALLGRANDAFGQVGGAAAGRVGDLLDHQPAPGPRALKEVVLRGPAGVASFDRLGVQGLLTVMLLISRSPGAMPANLAGEVEAFSTRLEAAIAARPSGRIDLDVSAAEVPVVEFVAKQAELRARLPMRTLQTCTTCKLERVVNPDFKRLQDHNRRKQVLTGAIGATVSARGVNPFLLVGSLLKLKNSEIDYVCPRCQGLDADTTVVTFCPQCGDRRGEAVLRRCPRCSHAFAGALTDAEPLWQPEPVTPAVPLGAPAAIAPPAPGAAPVAWAAPMGPPAAGMAPPTPGGGVPAGSPHPAAPAVRPEGWYGDPSGRHAERHWDGRAWTSFVRDGEAHGFDPM